jgi:serine phosphatase RsbU (regulator of sigma subunit)
MKKLFLYLIVVSPFALTVSVNSFAQENRLDSLLSHVHSIQYTDPQLGLSLMDSLEFNHNSQISDEQYIKMSSLRGNIYWYLNKMNTSLLYYKKGLDRANQTKDTSWIVQIEGDMGYVFSDQGKNDSAIAYLHRSIKMAESNNLITELNRNRIFLAHCYENTKQPEKALEIYQSLIGYFLKTETKNNIHTIYINMATCYQALGYTDTSKAYYEKVLADTDSNTLPSMTAIVKMNLAMVYADLKDFEKANQLIADAKLIFEKVGNPSYINSIKIIEADIFFAKGAYHECLALYKVALNSVIESEDLKTHAQVLEKIAETYKELGDFKNAYSTLIELRVVEDSLQAIQNISYVEDMEAKYQSEKKEKEIILLNEDRAIKEAEIAKKNAQVDQANFQKILFVLGLAALLIVIGFIMFGLRQKQRANQLLTSQKIQIEEKNREIVDSINYAKRIQAATLPSVKNFNDLLHDTFVLYQPKDIVAGDFYWLEKVNDWVYFAAADCTGHGVPGALVSVICSNALTKSLVEEKITQPGKLLDRTRELVIDQFGRSEEEIKDGMDISLCAFNSKTLELQWSGANNPLWILRNENAAIEIMKPDKQPIGKYGDAKPFTNHTIQLTKGDRIYIFTDGFHDQFGGSNRTESKAGGKKYKPSRLKDFITTIHKNRMSEQKDLLFKEFETWRGELEQIDDVCVIGVLV